MPKVIVTHSVADVAAWQQFAAERVEAIGNLGGTNVVDHVASDGSTVVAVSTDVDDVDWLIAALTSPPPEVAALMQGHGVQPPLTIFVQA